MKKILLAVVLVVVILVISGLCANAWIERKNRQTLREQERLEQLMDPNHTRRSFERLKAGDYWTPSEKRRIKGVHTAKDTQR